MNLKAFHIVFVTAASLLLFGFGGWSWRYAAAQDNSLYQIVSIASILCGVGLVAYGIWFWRKINRKLVAIGFVALSWWLAPSVAEACTVCYGEAEGPMIDAARGGVYLLFGLVFVMQVAFIGFFVYLRRRARDHHEATQA